jgi:hypothetical protein
MTASSLGGVHGGNIEKFITENNRVRAQNREFSNIISSFISASNSFQNIIDTEDFKDWCVYIYFIGLPL